MRMILLILLLAISASSAVRCEEVRITSDEVRLSNDSLTSAFIRDWYISRDLGHYLDNYNDYVVVESETTGEWSKGDKMIFSVSGNSFRQNRFWWNGLRIDSRALTGSSVFEQHLASSSLVVDYMNGELLFADDSVQQQMLSVSGNLGNIGGVSPGTKELINLFHSSGVERTMDSRPLDMRNHIVGAGTVDLTFALPDGEGKAYQHIYATVGQRKQTLFDATGISGMQPAMYWKAQIDGRIPLSAAQNGGQAIPLDALHYFVSARGADDYFSELLYNGNEQARMYSVMAGVVGRWKHSGSGGDGQLDIGLTLGSTTIRRDSVSFCRNLYDQDGEAFEPWYAPSRLTELNLSVHYGLNLLPWLKLEAKGLNSLVHQRVLNESFTTSIYTQTIAERTPTPLYTYSWQAGSFTTGLLENEVSVSAYGRLSEHLTGRASVGISLDGILLGKGRSLVSPNIVASAGLHWQPTWWFDMSLQVNHQRVRYTMDEARYLSADYLNADIRYSDGTLYGTTGGAYHRAAKDLWYKQPSYAGIDLPLRFTLDKEQRHHIDLLNTAKKFYNQWFTVYAGEEWSAEPVTAALPEWEKQYTVTTQPMNLMSGTFGGRTPYYLSNTVKYTYKGKKWFVALSWQSYLMAGFSTLGNGPLHNNIGSLSETTALANTFKVAHGDGKPYPANSRLNQDKSFIARLQVTYNPVKFFSASLNFKFKDGQPFTTYMTEEYTSSSGHRQVLLYNSDAKGINMANGVFGKREDAFFNLDLRLTGRWWTKKHLLMEVEMYWYNLYDFGTALTEYTFDNVNHPTYAYWTETRGQKSMKDSRTSMSLCIPRGVILSYRIGW